MKGAISLWAEVSTFAAKEGRALLDSLMRSNVIKDGLNVLRKWSEEYKINDMIRDFMHSAYSSDRRREEEDDFEL